MAAGATVLLVEDERGIRVAAETALVLGGLRVIPADTVESAWSLFLEHRPQLAILDLKLPDGSGVDLCRRMRGHEALGDIPIIILTGKTGLGSKRFGFDAGADQYLVKPVDPEELLLWSRALLRRLALDRGETRVLRAGELELDAAAHMVRWKKTPLPRLTVKEFDFLYFLVKHRPRVISRMRLLKEVWRTITVDHVIDAHLYNLRKKLPQEVSDHLQNIPGKGYRYIE
ncbi:MAG: response regulator transcription factor [Elusimicrobia bacterium]|nr:response regulator transcription factor [Elusimicrobiota bacterium]